MALLRIVVVLSAAVGAGVERAWSQAATATAPASVARPGDGAMSPQAAKALSELGSEDEKARAKAVAALDAAVGEQLRAMISRSDPEVQTRLATLLAYNESISKWALQAMSLPAGARQKHLAWGTQPEVLPLIARLYGSDLERRLAAVEALGEDKHEEASRLVAQLLLDNHPPIYTAAMELCFKREPTPAIVESLWERAVLAGLSRARGNVMAGDVIKFKGRDVGRNMTGALAGRMGDSDLATETLVHLKPEDLSERIAAVFERAEKDQSANRTWLYSPQNEPMRNVYRMIEEVKPAELVPTLLRQLDLTSGQKSTGVVGEKKYFWSHRTAALGALLTVVGEKPEEYGVQRIRHMQQVWTVESEPAEAVAIGKVKQWWSANRAGFMEKAREAATRPGSATAPATRAGG